jgi:Flp pilus assembly pilin Flp
VASPHRSLRSSGLRRWRDERGVALVEFALILPVFSMMIFGMLDFGRALNYWLDGTHLANEAARYSVVNRNPGASGGQNLCAWIRDQIVTDEHKDGGGASTSSGPTGPAQVTVETFDPNTSVDGDEYVRARVTSDFKFLALLDLVTIDLVTEAVMRVEVKPAIACSSP